MRSSFFHVVARKEIRRSHFNTFLCQMVLLSMSCPCSWDLVPNGGVATFILGFLDLNWLTHLKILEVGPFFGKVLLSFTFLCEMVLLMFGQSLPAPHIDLLRIGTNYDLRIIYTFAEVLLMSMLLYLLAVLLHWFLTYQIWVITPQELFLAKFSCCTRSCATKWCCQCLALALDA